jgi:dTDP-glucose 4,6-dehydratase
LVTGGAGFIGSAYVRHLIRDTDHEVTVLDALTYAGSLARLDEVAHDPRLTFVQGDVADPDAVGEVIAGREVVVHFAAESHVDRSLLDAAPFEHTNVVGTRVLCEQAGRAQVGRFVHISTDEVYGPIDQGACDETAPLAPTSPYARSKARGDEIVLDAVDVDGLPAVIVRPCNQFGPWQFPEKLIPYFVSRLLSGATAPVYGDGRQQRDWLHVLDTCAWLDAVVDRAEVGEVYNLAGHHERTNLEIAGLILDALDLDSSRLEFVADRPLHDRRYAASTDKIEHLAPRPTRPFDEAIHETVRWYVDHRDWWEPLLPRVRNR